MAGSTRSIDHAVLPVTTLTLARSRLTSLGFTVAPDARHPFGTGNCCVFLSDRSFLEPVTIVDRAAADMAAAEGVLFVKRIKRFTERQGEGFAMLALKSTDADADHADFEQAGISGGPVFRFSRKAARSDGSEQEVGFALAFTDSPKASDATFFACQHLAPGALFQPEYLEHANGAIGIGAVAAVATHPPDFRGYLSAAAGDLHPHTSYGGLATTADGQTVHILAPDAYRERYGLEPPDARRGLVFAACEIVVADLDRAIGYAGPTALRHHGCIVVPPSSGLGAALVFRTAEHG